MALSPRDALISYVSRALGKRKLLYFGTRGDDAASLIDIDAFDGCFSYINTWTGWPLTTTYSLEDITRTRVDLDTYDIDDHINDDHVQQLRQVMLDALSKECALLTYRPSEFLYILALQRDAHCTYLGPFFLDQHALEYKPWVEYMIAHATPPIPWLEWNYVAKEDREIEAKRMSWPVMLRGPRGSGGAGMRRASNPADFTQGWPSDDTAFVNVAAYRRGCLPLNIGAVIWPDGEVSVHWPSVQLIGLAGLSSKPFGYCGNDFALARDLPPHVLDTLEARTKQVGSLLAARGYLGAFGADWLLDPTTDELLFTEVNPRFQGSTRLSSQLSKSLDEPCLLLDHAAAWLWTHDANARPPRPNLPPLRQRMRDLPEASQIVVHNTSPEAGIIDPRPAIHQLLARTMVDSAAVIVGPQTRADPDAVLCNLTVTSSVTPDGYRLNSDLERALSDAGVYRMCSGVRTGSGTTNSTANSTANGSPNGTTSETTDSATNTAHAEVPPIIHSPTDKEGHRHVSSL